MTFHIFNLN